MTSRHQTGAIGIYPAAATLPIKITARYARIHNFTRIFKLNFLQTATGTSITELFPLLTAHQLKIIL
jgi:hypothetical protein